MVRAAGTRMERLVALHRGARLFKWEHFYRIYDAHFARWRGRRPTVLEIGLGQGGSLQLWRRYFGAGARLIGVDFRPECAAFSGRNVAIEIGSQADVAFLAEVARRHGPFDLVIDDGSTPRSTSSPHSGRCLITSRLAACMCARTSARPTGKSCSAEA